MDPYVQTYPNRFSHLGVKGLYTKPFTLVLGRKVLSTRLIWVGHFKVGRLFLVFVELSRKCWECIRSIRRENGM